VPPPLVLLRTKFSLSPYHSPFLVYAANGPTPGLLALQGSTLTVYDC
jgi:hypothetical protein